MATASTITALALAAAAAGTQYYNTKQTEKKQDNALADQIRNQSKRQQEADSEVAKQVADLKGSTSADDKAKALDSYMKELVRNRGKIQAGLTPEGIGGTGFGADALAAGRQVDANASSNANLMARMDAPMLQRQGEGFGFGNLATNLGLIGRKAAGDNYLDELRLRNIRRNAGMDLAAGLMGAASGAVGAGAGAQQTDYATLARQAYAQPLRVNGYGG